MKKIIYPVILLTLLSLASCKSKKKYGVHFAFACFKYRFRSCGYRCHCPGRCFCAGSCRTQRAWMSRKKRKVNRQRKQTIAGTESADRVLREAKITSSTESVSSAYAGVDRVVKYDFTHRDVPESF